MNGWLRGISPHRQKAQLQSGRQTLACAMGEILTAFVGSSGSSCWRASVGRHTSYFRYALKPSLAGYCRACPVSSAQPTERRTVDYKILRRTVSGNLCTGRRSRHHRCSPRRAIRCRVRFHRWSRRQPPQADPHRLAVPGSRHFRTLNAIANPKSLCHLLGWANGSPEAIILPWRMTSSGSQWGLCLWRCSTFHRADWYRAAGFR